MRSLRLAVAFFALAASVGSGATAHGSVEIAACAAHLSARAFPIGTGPCRGVRPGAYYSSETSGCTFNFLFRGDDGYRYIGSAGHCLLEVAGEGAWPIGKGPVIRSDGGKVVGRGAYAILRDGQDFALIRLDRGVQASPQMCHFGGPTGVDDSHPTEPVVLEHYGQGFLVSDVAPGRTAVGTDMRREDVAIAAGIANFGDSGSGVTLDGRALGVLVALVPTEGGTLYITRLTPQLERAEGALGTELTLLTAPRL